MTKCVLRAPVQFRQDACYWPQRHFVSAKQLGRSQEHNGHNGKG